MKTRLYSTVERLRESYWFIPSLMSAGAALCGWWV
jgi:hypothetical protein